jgi:hypothetical protein
MGNTTKTTSIEFIPDKQSSTRQSLEAVEVQSEVSIDYAGASRKTDPSEIALVKKLDLCMMVSFSSHLRRLSKPSNSYDHILSY